MELCYLFFVLSSLVGWKDSERNMMSSPLIRMSFSTGSVRRFSSQIDLSRFANQKEITAVKVQEAIIKHQRHKSDTGSPAVQSKLCVDSWLVLTIFVSRIWLLLFSSLYIVATATEKILSLAKHFSTHRKDYASRRGYQVQKYL